MSPALKEKHTSCHAALATAVRVLIELEAINHIIEQSPTLAAPASLRRDRERMQQEVERWADTEDIYALGIMAPLGAMGKV